MGVLNLDIYEVSLAAFSLVLNHFVLIVPIYQTYLTFFFLRKC